jgi:hypothetical protein
LLAGCEAEGSKTQRETKREREREREREGGRGQSPSRVIAELAEQPLDEDLELFSEGVSLGKYETSRYTES